MGPLKSGVEGFGVTPKSAGLAHHVLRGELADFICEVEYVDAPWCILHAMAQPERVSRSCEKKALSPKLPRLSPGRVCPARDVVKTKPFTQQQQQPGCA